MSDEHKPPGPPIFAPVSMQKIRDKKAELARRVEAREITTVQSLVEFKAFASGTIAHEREQFEASRDLSPAVDAMPEY